MRLTRIAGYGGGDLLLALGLSAFLVISLAASGALHGRGNLFEVGAAVGLFLRTQCGLQPQLAADAAAVLFALSALESGFGLRHRTTSATSSRCRSACSPTRWAPTPTSAGRCRRCANHAFVACKLANG